MGLSRLRGRKLDDFELLDAWQAGDGEAGDALFRRHFLRIYRFFRSKAGAEAEDLTQRTFLALVEKRDRIHAGSSFNAYAFGIARNQLLMFFRRVGHGKETDLHDRSVADLSGRSPERELKKGEELRLVLRAMQRIPIDFQVALELYYWEEMPITDIAEVLEVPEGTVKSRLWRGREMLRQEISSAPAEDALRESTLQALNEWIEVLRDNVEGSDE